MSVMVSVGRTVCVLCLCPILQKALDLLAKGPVSDSGRGDWTQLELSASDFKVCFVGDTPSYLYDFVRLLDEVA